MKELMVLWLLAVLFIATSWRTVLGTENGTARNVFDFNNTVRKMSLLLSNNLREAVKNELVTGRFQGVSYTKQNNLFADDQQVLNSISAKLSAKIKSARNVLFGMLDVVRNRTDMHSFTKPCPFNSIRNAITTSNPLLYEPAGPRVTVEVQQHYAGHLKDVQVKRQFFLSHSDLATDKDCITTPHSNLRYLYHKVVNPFPKLIVFILDLTMNKGLVHKAIEVIKEMVQILGPSDMIAINIANGTGFLKFEDLCSRTGEADVGNVTETNRILLFGYLASIETSTIFKADNLHKEIRHVLQQDNLPENKLIISLLSWITENWEYIYPAELSDENVSFAFGSFASTEKNKHCSTKKAIHVKELNKHVTNIIICPTSISGQIASEFFTSFPSTPSFDNMVQLETPNWEPTERDFMVPLLLASWRGVFGVDLFWADLAEDIIYFKKNNLKRRAFVLNKKGIVFMHSFFPRPELSTEKIKFTDVEIVENNEFIAEVKHEMLKQPNGTVTQTLKNTGALVVYTWQKIDDLLIACIVTEKESKVNISHEPNSSYLKRNRRDILYHRLDLFPPKNGNLCRHFKQIATIDQGTVYLSPSSFQSPFSYLQDMSDGQDAIMYMQNYMAYLKGVAFGFLSNPGLKNEIQQDVTLLNSILSYYKKKHLHGVYNKYIVRRYAVTESGVLVMFPGTVLEYDYEPIKRPWYTSALENPGKIILSPPNLDVGGAGYVVSVSYVIQPTNEPLLVVSMDVTMGFLYKMLLENFPLCAQKVKCFIMNNKGYLISHPGLLDPNSSGPIEQQHITHKESLIAMDMLNHKEFVTKSQCNNFPDRTIQRFYEFNMSLPGVFSSMVSDHCLHYYIAAVPGTNAFVVLANGTCNLKAFCPCSTDDRLCLNCNRMEQNECECPCECSAETPYCHNTTKSKNTTDIPMCPMAPENNHHKSHFFYNFAENLKPCFDFECETYTSYGSCLGVMGCEWCQIDTDGTSTLNVPFCTSQSTCFNGVLGAVTPYGEGTLGRVSREDALGSYSTIGPIAGCIVTVCLVVAVAIYCYKQNVSSASCHNLYVDGPAETWPEQDLQLSHLQSDDNHGDHSSGQDKLLPAAEAEPPISPYKVLTGYRRPHTTGDSDHGYSTMTPHEDSEATAFSMTEPIVLMDDTNMSDVSCSVSTKMPSLYRPKPVDMSVTILPSGKHSVIAPVTVHRNMEAS